MKYTLKLLSVAALFLIIGYHQDQYMQALAFTWKKHSEKQIEKEKKELVRDNENDYLNDPDYINWCDQAGNDKHPVCNPDYVPILKNSSRWGGGSLGHWH